MKLRKIVSISLCVLLTVSLLGCGKKEKLSKTAESFTKITEIAKDSRIFEVNYDKVDYHTCKNTILTREAKI